MKTAQSAKSSKRAHTSQHAPFCAEINHWNTTLRLPQHSPFWTATHWHPWKRFRLPLAKRFFPVDNWELLKNLSKQGCVVSFLRTKKSRAKGPVGQLPPKPNKGHRRVCAEECCDVHSRDCTCGVSKIFAEDWGTYRYHTVDGRIRLTSWYGSLSHYLQCFIDVRCRISWFYQQYLQYQHLINGFACPWQADCGFGFMSSFCWEVCWCHQLHMMVCKPVFSGLPSAKTQMVRIF